MSLTVTLSYPNSAVNGSGHGKIDPRVGRLDLRGDNSVLCLSKLSPLKKTRVENKTARLTSLRPLHLDVNVSEDHFHYVSFAVLIEALLGLNPSYIRADAPLIKPL